MDLKIYKQIFHINNKIKCILKNAAQNFIVVYKQKPFPKNEWFGSLQVSDGTINLCFSHGGASFILMPKGLVWSGSRMEGPWYHINKAFSALCWGKNGCPPLGPITTKRSHLKKALFYLLILTP